MKKSEEKPSCKVRVESGEKTFGIVVGNNEETISGISDETDDDRRC